MHSGPVSLATSTCLMELISRAPSRLARVNEPPWPSHPLEGRLVNLWDRR